jgi:hypothetical protein
LWESLAASLRYVPDDPAGRPAAGTLETFFEPVAPVESSPTRDNPWPHAERFDTGELRLWTRETVHVPAKPSTSLEIAVDATNDGENAAAPRVAWWSGDSTVDATSLQQLEPRTTVFFHDCTFVEYPGQVHGEFRLLEQLPANIREKVVLMHHEDDLEDHRARAESLGFRIALPGHVYDLTTGRRIA